jgi:hypothetical protein
MRDLYHTHLHGVVAQHLSKARTPLQLVHAAQKLAKSVHRIADAHHERAGGSKEALRNAVFRDVTGLQDADESNVRAVRLACRFGWDDVVKVATDAASTVKGAVGKATDVVKGVVGKATDIAGSVLDTLGNVSLAGVAEFIKSVAPSVTAKYEEAKAWVMEAIETGQQIMNGGLKMYSIAEQVIDAYDTAKACILGGDAAKCARMGPALRDTMAGLREAASMITGGGEGGLAAAAAPSGGGGGVSCTVPGKGVGSCVPTARCTGKPYRGFCPGAADIQCCIR